MAKENAIVPLTPAKLRSASRWLAQRDSALREVLDAHGYPQLWNRRPGFSTTIPRFDSGTLQQSNYELGNAYF